MHIDTIFLLSAEEYEKYKEKIPSLRVEWWLRSVGDHSNYAALVDFDGSIYRSGVDIDNDYISVRPAIRIEDKYEIGEIIIKHNFPWIVIDDGIAIAEVPIGCEKFDDYCNDYMSSHIRRVLQNWLYLRDKRLRHKMMCNEKGAKMTKKEQEAYNRGFEQGRIRGRVEARTEKENADGCVDCAYIGRDEWDMPCLRCINNTKNYWRKADDKSWQGF